MPTLHCTMVLFTLFIPACPANAYRGYCANFSRYDIDL